MIADLKAHVLLKCLDCRQKSWGTRENVSQYLRPGWIWFRCPRCESTSLVEVGKRAAPTPAPEARTPRGPA